MTILLTIAFISSIVAVAYAAAMALVFIDKKNEGKGYLEF